MHKNQPKTFRFSLFNIGVILILMAFASALTFLLVEQKWQNREGGEQSSNAQKKDLNALPFTDTQHQKQRNTVNSKTKRDNRPNPISHPTAHRSKSYISKNCAIIKFKSQYAITGAAFVQTQDKPNADKMGKIYLALSHGAQGLSLFDPQKKSLLWHKPIEATIVSAFKDRLLVYSETKTGSTLNRFQISANGNASFTSTESPSDIAPTTLQRSVIAALGPVLIKDNGLLLNTSFVEFPARPKALAATQFNLTQDFTLGAAAIAFPDNHIEIWDQSGLFHGC